MKILAVMVRYEMELAASETVQGLSAALAADEELCEAYRLLIWDNSPQPLIDPQLPVPFEYRRSERNLGVSGAYNGAMEYALEQGMEWMLLLDQDSEVTAEFLRILLRHARALHGDARIAAIAPTVKVGAFVASPREQLFNRSRPYPAGECGIAPGEAGACNSGCLIRTSALQEVGGFSTDFWLDYSDVYVFHQFFLRGKRVWRAADAELQHEMTMLDYDRLMSAWRYRNFSFAETAFLDLYRSRAERAVQHGRLLARAVKQKLKFKNPEFSRITWEQFFYRIRTPRRVRLARWKADGDRRRGLPESAA